MKKKLTQKQKEKRDQRRSDFRKIIKTVADMTVEQRQEIVGKIGLIPTVTGGALSPFNSCVVLYQNKDAAMVGGFRQWKAAGRYIRKGEHGVGIWIPAAKPKSDDNDKEDIRFFMGTVFDISQTEEINEEKAK